MPREGKRVAVYARVSTLDQHPEMQLRELREYAKRRDWQTIEFVDHGVSGAETRRPRLVQMQELLNKHRFDLVLVWKFDRLFRSVPHIVEFMQHLKHLEVEFVSMTEQIDTESPHGRLVFHVLAAIAEFERDLIRERIVAGLAAAKARGVRLGRPEKKVDRAALLCDRRDGFSYSALARKYAISKTSAIQICRGDVRREVRE